MRRRPPGQRWRTQQDNKKMRGFSQPFDFDGPFAHPDRPVLRRGGPRADDQPGQHLALLLQQDLRLPVGVRPGEGQQGGGGAALRLRGESAPAPVLAAPRDSRYTANRVP